MRQSKQEATILHSGVPYEQLCRQYPRGTTLHPRRSLGDRYRTQAERFLSSGNEGDAIWGEQMASKAVLHDFTNPSNWKTLVKSRIALRDESGVSSALKDLFSVLGWGSEFN